MARTTDIPGLEKKIVSKLRLSDLEFMLHVGSSRSLTTTAEKLGVTQPAASRWLMQLEGLFQTHLFYRNGVRGLNPTETGERVITAARALLADVGHLSEDIRAIRAGVGGTLRLGVVNLMSSQMTTQLVSMLESPDLRIAVSLTESDTMSLLERLKDEMLDAVIGRCTPDLIEPPLAYEVLFRQRAVLVMSAKNRLSEQSNIDLRRLQEARWVLPHANTPLRRAIDGAFNSARVDPPRARIETDSMKLMHALLVSTDQSVAIVPSEIAHELEVLGGVRTRTLPLKLELPPVGLVYYARHVDRPQLKVLRSTLRKIAPMRGS